MKSVQFPRRVLVLGSVLVVIVLIVLVTLGEAFATGTRASSASPSSSQGRHSLMLIEKNIQAAVIDLPPAGPSLGDLRVGHGLLYNQQGTQQIGRVDFFYSLTDLAATAREPILLKGTLTFTLPHGTIEASGLSDRPSITALPGTDVYALIGGTGSYRQVAGQVQLQRQADVLLYTFSFTS